MAFSIDRSKRVFEVKTNKISSNDLSKILNTPYLSLFALITYAGYNVFEYAVQRINYESRSSSRQIVFTEVWKR